MPNQKSLIDVDVNAKEFERFAALFDQYQDQLHHTPNDWEQVAKEQEKLAKQFAKMNDAFSLQTHSQEKQDESDKERIRRLRENESLWSKMAQHSQSMSHNVLDIGNSLLKWGGLIGGGALFGSLFGIDRLAHSIGDTRTASMGFGMSPSAMQSFGVNFAKAIPDTQGFLSSMTNMETDITKRTPWYALMHGQPMSGDATKDTLAMLQGIRDFTQRTPKDMLGTYGNAYQIPLDVQSLQRIKGMDDREWGGMVSNFNRDQKSFGLSNSGAKAWQNLSQQFERVSTLLKDKLAISLEPLAPALTRLSSAAGDLVGAFLKAPEVKTAIDDFSKWLEDAARSGKADDVTKNMHELSTAAKDVADWLNSVAAAGNLYARTFHDWMANAGQRAGNFLTSSKESAWDWGTRIAQWLNTKDVTPERANARLAQLDAQSGFSPGTLAWLQANTPGSWAGGVGPMHIPQSMGLPGANLEDFDTSARAAALLFRQEQQRYHGDTMEAMAALQMGDGDFNKLLNAHPKDWQKYASADVQGKLSDFQRATSGDAQSVIAPPGTGVTVYVINATGRDTNIALSQLGGR